MGRFGSTMRPVLVRDAAKWRVVHTPVHTPDLACSGNWRRTRPEQTCTARKLFRCRPRVHPRSESLGEGMWVRVQGDVPRNRGRNAGSGCAPAPIPRQRDAYDVRLQRKAAAGDGQEEAPRLGDSRPRRRLCPDRARARPAPDLAARERGAGGLVEQGSAIRFGHLAQKAFRLGGLDLQEPDERRLVVLLEGNDETRTDPPLEE
jgi:hypothetical protein